MKNRFFIACAFAFSLIASSCENTYLDTLPTASVDAASAYATTKNAAAAINGIYRALILRYPEFTGTFGASCTDDHFGSHGRRRHHWGNCRQLARGTKPRWVAHRSDTNVMTTLSLMRCIIGSSVMPILPFPALIRQ